MDLQYWMNGQPILPSDSSSTKAFKYWIDGVPFTFIEGGAAPPVVEYNSVFFSMNF